MPCSSANACHSACGQVARREGRPTSGVGDQDVGRRGGAPIGWGRWGFDRPAVVTQGEQGGRRRACGPRRPRPAPGRRPARGSFVGVSGDARSRASGRSPGGDAVEDDRGNSLGHVAGALEVDLRADRFPVDGLDRPRRRRSGTRAWAARRSASMISWSRSATRPSPSSACRDRGDPLRQGRVRVVGVRAGLRRARAPDAFAALSELFRGHEAPEAVGRPAAAVRTTTPARPLRPVAVEGGREGVHPAQASPFTSRGRRGARRRGRRRTPRAARSPP